MWTNWTCNEWKRFKVSEEVSNAFFECVKITPQIRSRIRELEELYSDSEMKYGLLTTKKSQRK